MFSTSNTSGEKVVNYKTAQNLALFPENSHEDTKAMLNHLGVPDELKTKLFILLPNQEYQKKQSGKHPFKTPNYSVYEAVKYFVDLRGQLSKKVVKGLAPYCQDTKESKEMLQLFENKDKF